MVDPAAEITGQYQSMLAATQMRTADAMASGLDFVETPKMFMAGKFYTDMMYSMYTIADNEFRLLIDMSKPIDLHSLTFGWVFKDANNPYANSPDKSESNATAITYHCNRCYRQMQLNCIW